MSSLARREQARLVTSADIDIAICAQSFVYIPSTQHLLVLFMARGRNAVHMDAMFVGAEGQVVDDGCMSLP
jgi:hypothetical protein